MDGRAIHGAMTDREAAFGHDPWDPISWTIRSLMWRVAATIAAAVIWLSFTLLFLAFWAHGLTWFQDLAVGVVAFLVVIGGMTALWVAFGLRLFHRWAEA